MNAELGDYQVRFLGRPDTPEITWITWGPHNQWKAGTCPDLETAEDEALIAVKKLIGDIGDSNAAALQDRVWARKWREQKKPADEGEGGS